MHVATLNALAAALAATVTVTRAHVVLLTPTPFLFLEYGPTNPLDPDGSNFPCKKRAGQTLEVDGERTRMVVGEEQLLTFEGRAVHGGGSCQIAITADQQPTNSSRWMVIHSIEGGCPARNQKGNLEGPNQDEYHFVIPEDLPVTGDATLAWTWSNRISGSAELYMNCAPITIVGEDGGSTTGGNSKRISGAERRRRLQGERTSKRADFPELFLANLGDLTGDCTTDEAVKQQLAIAYPNPGSSVEHPEGTENLFQQPCDGNPRAGDAPPGQPGSGDPRPTTSQAPPDPVPTTSTTPTTSNAPPVPTTDEAPSPPQPTATETTDVVPAPSPTDINGTCVEGHLTCMEDGLGFKTCTGGQLRPDGDAVPMAPGYKCVPGSGVGLDIHPI